jgi:hypothetical protein
MWVHLTTEMKLTISIEEYAQLMNLWNAMRQALRDRAKKTILASLKARIIEADRGTTSTAEAALLVIELPDVAVGDLLAEPEPEVPNVALREHIPLSNEASMVTAHDSDDSYSEREPPDDEGESHLPLQSQHRKKIVSDFDDKDDAYDGDENRDSDGGPTQHIINQMLEDDEAWDREKDDEEEEPTLISDDDDDQTEITDAQRR